MRYEYDAVLHELPEKGGAYVAFPWDLRKETGKGSLKVHAEFDGVPYDGSIVNLGLKNPDGSVCYIIGVLKSIRQALQKHDGEATSVFADRLTEFKTSKDAIQLPNDRELPLELFDMGYTNIYEFGGINTWTAKIVTEG